MQGLDINNSGDFLQQEQNQTSDIDSQPNYVNVTNTTGNLTSLSNANNTSNTNSNPEQNTSNSPSNVNNNNTYENAEILPNPPTDQNNQVAAWYDTDLWFDFVLKL